MNQRMKCLLFILTLVVGCNSEPVSPARRSFDFNFNSGLQGWTADFSDYPVGQDSALALRSGWKALPSPLSGHGFNVSGNNGSDDLFMFIKRRITGLEPNTQYSISFVVSFATNAPHGCYGIGGAPGEAVIMKAGASSMEPVPVPSASQWYVMNIDKGNQQGDGKHAVVLGTIANSSNDCLNPPYELKKLEIGSGKLRVTSDNAGAIWIFFGTDSGYEGTTSLYYVQATVIVTAP